MFSYIKNGANRLYAKWFMRANNDHTKNLTRYWMFLNNYYFIWLIVLTIIIYKLHKTYPATDKAQRTLYSTNLIELSNQSI